MSKLRNQLDQSNVAKFADKDVIRKAKDRKFYGYTFDQTGRHPISLAIDFIQRDGDRLGIFYMEIASPVLLKLGKGDTPQTILLKTSNVEISISGKNLGPVYAYILEQRLVWAKEESSSFNLEDQETVIESIDIQAES